MNQSAKCLGAESPKFYMIHYQNVHTIVAMQMADKYLFNLPDKWYSVDSTTIDRMISAIDQSVADQIKSKIQSADKNAIRLLLICSNLFDTTLPIFKPLLNEISTLNIDSNVSIHMNNFVSLQITDLKQVQSIGRMPWKLVYINKLLKSRGLTPAVSQWNIVISPVKYIFNNCNACDLGMRLIQLHKAITQIQKDDELSSSNIYQLSQTLDESISNYDFSLPDICLHFEYPSYQPIDHQNIIQDGLQLIANLASIGVVNNCAELNNIGLTTDGIAFKSYESAILADMHGVSFDFGSAESTLNQVYKKSQSISKDSILVFNCLIMYDTIRLMLSIQKQSGSTKTQQIIADANSIMKQVYDSSPTFDHKKSLSAAINWLYEKHFGKIPECLPFVVCRDHESDKYNYMSKYLHQFAFSQTK